MNFKGTITLTLFYLEIKQKFDALKAFPPFRPKKIWYFKISQIFANNLICIFAEEKHFWWRYCIFKL